LKQQELINRLRDELTHVVAQTEGNAVMGLTDHNKIAENLICGLTREILGFRGIRNLNASEHANYPAIDLADFGARIAVQVSLAADPAATDRQAQATLTSSAKRFFWEARPATSKHYAIPCNFR
jgi:hypothetical protein